MLFEQKHKEIMEKVGDYTESRLWLNTIIFGSIVFLINLFYLFLRRGSFEIFLLNQAFANCGMILIGLSFALSGLCYFFNFVDTKIIYRKHLGIVGFAAVLGHIAIILIPLSNRFPFPGFFLEDAQIVPFVAGVVAAVIFTMMAAISNRYAIHELGGAHWRLLLRTGYLAYFLALSHIGLTSAPFWLMWTASFKPILPPLSLLVFIFGIFVLVLRFALFLSTHAKSSPVSV